jgi:hypothetical protein
MKTTARKQVHRVIVAGTAALAWVKVRSPSTVQGPSLTDTRSLRECSVAAVAAGLIGAFATSKLGGHDEGRHGRHGRCRRRRHRRRGEGRLRSGLGGTALGGAC